LTNGWGRIVIAAMDQPDMTGVKVLVADDEPKLRALVAGCVRSLGCETFEAKDGDEAWLVAQTRRLDVVVLDVMMPGMSGWEVCRRIKASAKSARGTPPKVLMLTGIGEHLNEMTSPLFAADGWLDKPFDLGELKRKVAELGAASLREIPPPAPSGPSLKKARPAQGFAAAEEPGVAAEELGVAAEEPGVGAASTDAVPHQARPKKKRKAAKKRAAAKPAKRKVAKKKKAAKKKAAKRKAAKKSPSKGVRNERPQAKRAKKKKPQPNEARRKKVQPRAAAAKKRKLRAKKKLRAAAKRRPKPAPRRRERAAAKRRR
jgi:CheY-like chemotaxis protein